MPEGILTGVRRTSSIAWVALCTACVGATPPAQTVVPNVEYPGSPPSEDPELAILSAHFAINNAPALGGADVLPIVFNVEVDASTVVPRYFIVARGDGSQAWPEDAVLAPANEADENRTVVLLGDFGGPEQDPPTHVSVAGPLYGEQGEALRGLTATVLPFHTPPAVVAAELLQPAPGRCPDATWVVRTYWSEGLRDLSAEAGTTVSVQTADGATIPPAGFDDQAAGGKDDGEDNVLDVCVNADARPVGVHLPAGLLTDPAGHVNTAADVDVPLGHR